MMHLCGEGVYKETIRCGSITDFSTSGRIRRETVEKPKHINLSIHCLSAGQHVNKICEQNWKT
jgi:hypothetical protein